MKIYFKPIFLTFLIAFLMACSKPSSEFLGTWENVKKPSDIFAIEENGDNFILTNIRTSEKFPLVFADNNMSFDSGIASGKFIYLEKTDTLMLSIKAFFASENLEYKRVRL